MAGRLYRDYDQAELDRQLNLRARWPEHTEFFARWARDSAEVRGRQDQHLDLAYGPSAGQKLDLFVPPGQSAAPLLVFIHGGYWQSLDKGDFSYLAPPYLEAGIAFASLNYDLAPRVGITQIVRQTRAALAWLYRHAAELGLDPGRLYVSGHSAGGHLTAITLATNWRAEAGLGPDLPEDLVKGGCSVSGVYDLEPIRLSYHQAVVNLTSEEVRELSPLGRVPLRQAHMILAVGSEETEEFNLQQAEYAEACRGAGLAPQIIELPGRNHFSAIDAFGEIDHPLFAATASLVLGRSRTRTP